MFNQAVNVTTQAEMVDRLRQRGRPPKLTEPLIDALLARLERGDTIEMACLWTDVHPRTLKRWRTFGSKHPETVEGILSRRLDSLRAEQLEQRERARQYIPTRKRQKRRSSRYQWTFAQVYLLAICYALAQRDAERQRKARATANGLETPKKPRKPRRAPQTRQRRPRAISAPIMPPQTPQDALSAMLAQQHASRLTLLDQQDTATSAYLTLKAQEDARLATSLERHHEAQRQRFTGRQERTTHERGTP